MLLLTCSPALAGCGFGLGPGEGSGSAGVLVTRDFGRAEVASFQIDGVGPSTTVLRALESELPVKTSYGGGFVDGIAGIDGRTGGRPTDWFFFVNGIESEVGGADFLLSPGDRVWWDYRDWGEVMYVGSVVGSYPAPLTGGYRGSDWPVRLVCSSDRVTCGLVRSGLEDDGIDLEEGSESGEALEVVVGEWSRIGEDHPVLGGPPSRSGVFARFRSRGKILELLDRTGRVVVGEGEGTGMVASTGGTGEPPTWFVTGTDRTGVRSAARLLEPDRLGRSYAVAAVDGEAVRLPTERIGGSQ